MSTIVNFNESKKSKGKGKIFVVAGSAGSGKNTLIKRILDMNLGITFIPSFTTRKMRQGESSGNPYIFVGKETFEGMIDKNEFLEYEKVHGLDYYGTHLATYKYAIDNGYHIISDLDVKGATKVKSIFKEDAVLLFIKVPNSETLKARLIQRGENSEEIENRLKRVEFEEAKIHLFDHIILNDDLEKAVEEFKAAIEQYA
ncbi:guanylate kinase [Serpentinicella sp. ANB-PHB4]|uniref:guanylate kinase n=1 Tax=Serpentinicella sp. ANB-PHB4 TaxID=3074076 RepID=UPI0028656261|nr:guanylate kinase [Serpentinicella sp. ANB-PHB4]MDR5658644.1 guanylate kinase [Serpentinicella sp. ANB-PHB4]